MRAWQVVLVVVGVVVALLMALVWPALMPVLELSRWSRTYTTQDEAKAALTQNPNDPIAHYTMASQANNVADRLKEIKIVCQLDPKNQLAQYERGVLLHQNGQNAEAIPLLKSITHVRLKAEANVILQRIGKAPANPTPHSPSPLPR